MSIHTLFAGLAGAISDDSLGLELDKDGPEGDWILKLNGNPTNTGLMGIRVTIGIKIHDLDEELIAANSTSIILSPGEQKPFNLVLIIPFDKIQQYRLNSTQPQAIFELNGACGVRVNLA
jgi:hypothetical protein